MSSKKVSRRDFARGTVVAASAATAGCIGGASSPDDGRTRRALPPANAKLLPTACDYCIVGCAYQAVVWPADEGRGEGSAEDEPWFSPNMHTVVQIDGRPHNVVVRPDPHTPFVNRGRDHSVRGGTLAQKLYAEDRLTRDRLKKPQLRIAGRLVDIEWDHAIELMAATTLHTIEQHGLHAWGMKQYSYQYYENTYALTKLALDAIGTPVWAVHDKPAETTDAPGMNDAGINNFSASYQDWYDAEVIVVSGVSLYDAKSVLFHQWVQAGGAKLVVINPRRDLTAAYAERTGGVHLQLEPGTDTVLNNALARHIIEQGWEDAEFIASRVANRQDIDLETHFRRRELAMDLAEYRTFLLSDDRYTLEGAERITGVPRDQIAAAARLMAAPTNGVRPKTSLMLEKGNYWSHNVDNTASYVSLGLLVGAGGRPGQVISRAGGHQRGMIKGGHYPLHRSPDHYQGQPLPLNVDRHVMEGHVRFMWVVGTTWFAAMGASQALARRVAQQARETAPQLTDDLLQNGRVDIERAKALLCERIDNGGMVLAQQEIYANPLTDYADLVLPAATWGEADFSRMQGERRLRIYSKIMDPPGEAKPDWWIAAKVAQRIGYDGFSWRNENSVFEEAAEASRGSVHDYAALVEQARRRGGRGHELLRKLGADGIQCPIVADGDELRGTQRLHDDSFSTKSGRALFVRGSWSRVEPVQARCRPSEDQLWVINMRVNRLWQSMADDARIPFRGDRFPANFLEIHPDDAAPRGIESGDWLELRNDEVEDQLGETHAVVVRAIAYVTDCIKPGVTCGYFNYRGRLENAVNSLTSGQVDPMNPVYRYKLGKASITRVGPSEFKETLRFLPNNAV